MAYGSLRPAWAAWLALGSVLALPIAVRADRGDCDIGPVSPVRACSPVTACTTRAGCISAIDRADQTCQIVRGGSARECLADCSTMFECSTSDDCPTLNGLTGTCSPTITSPSICSWFSSSVLPYQQITYCATASTTHVTDSNISSCHRIPGSSPARFTPDYFLGDCDDDGCPNGFDTNPCAVPDVGTSCTPNAGEPAVSPFCAPLPAIACAYQGGTISCGDARPCNGADTALGCDVGQCETGWSDVPRCRPPCSDLFLCARATGTPAEQCPILNGVSGGCIPLPSGIAPVMGRDGLCIYSDFFDTSCTSSTLDAECFQLPGGGVTDNFFAGDCDGDGAPNACDTERCTAGGGTSMCVTVPGTSCTPSYTPPADAGVDAGSDAGSDAGTTSDGGTQQSDGGSNVAPDASTSDAGGVAIDASVTMDAAAGTGFSGGGGCRCAAAGVRVRSSMGASLLLLALGLVIAQRRRGR